MKLDSQSLKFDYLSYYWVTPLDSEQEYDQYQNCNHGVCHVKLILRASAVHKSHTSREAVYDPPRPT